MIDFHTHIFPAEVKTRRERWIGKDPCFSEIYSNPKAVIATAEELVQSMDEAGVHSSVAQGIGWKSLDLCREHNNYMIESHQKYGKKIIPFCSVQPLDGDASYYEIERCVKASMAGIGELRPDTQGLIEKDITYWKPVMEAAKKWDLPVLIHSSEPVGHSYAGKGEVSLPYLYRLLCAFNDIKIVLAHWGGGMIFYSLMPEVAKALVNTYFDTSATNFLYSPEIFATAFKLAGKEKIIFGSDYPLISHTRAIQYLHSLKLQRDELEAITEHNASTLLRIK